MCICVLRSLLAARPDEKIEKYSILTLCVLESCLNYVSISIETQLQISTPPLNVSLSPLPLQFLITTFTTQLPFHLLRFPLPTYSPSQLTTYDDNNT